MAIPELTDKWLKELNIKIEERERTKKQRWLKSRIISTVCYLPFVISSTYRLIVSNDKLSTALGVICGLFIFYLIYKYVPNPNIIARMKNHRHVLYKQNPFKLSKYFNYDYNQPQGIIHCDREDEVTILFHNSKMVNLPYIDHRKYTDKQLNDKVQKLVAFL